jgi:UDP-GlcNAc:undecaprenyl-phosphate GlcNAc-1-phosphate transferase
MNFDYYNIILFFISTIIFIFCLINRFRIGKYFRILDKPDNKRKIHKYDTPLTGSLAIFLIFLMICCFNLIYNSFNNTLLIILINSSLIFLIGFYDDRKNLSPYFKLTLIGLIFLVSLKFSDNLVLNNIYFSSIDKRFFLNEYLSIFLTILCLLLLTNALNLADGINSLANLLVTIWLIFILSMNTDNVNNIFKFLLLFILVNNYFIYKGKYFLGDSGSLFFAALVGMLSIYNYNILFSSGLYLPAAEDLFIIFMIPGFDMLRLFIERIIQKKDPFKADNNHLHHYLIKSYKLQKSLIIYLILVGIPIFLTYNLETNKILIITISLIIYLLLIIFLKNLLNNVSNKKKSI